MSPDTTQGRSQVTDPAVALVAAQGPNLVYHKTERDANKEYRMDEMLHLETVLMKKKRELQELDAVVANRRQELEHVLRQVRFPFVEFFVKYKGESRGWN